MLTVLALVYYSNLCNRSPPIEPPGSGLSAADDLALKVEQVGDRMHETLLIRPGDGQL
jgi:hypothetical protein